MTAPASQPVPLSTNDPRIGAEQDQVTAVTGMLDVTLRHAAYGSLAGIAPPGGPSNLIPAWPPAALFGADGNARSSAHVAAHDDDETWCTAGTQFIPGLPQEDATGPPGLSITDRGGVAVVSLRGDLDLLGACMLQAYLSGIRWQAWARSVADLADLAFIDCACLSVLVRHCKEIRGQGGSFALAGPQLAVFRILAVTGLLTWFEVYDTVQEAATGAGTQRSPAYLRYPHSPG
jgi:anti-sigma B factor antagonist